jgi:hypothetical protein
MLKDTFSYFVIRKYGLMQTGSKVPAEFIQLEGKVSSFEITRNFEFH